MKTYAPKEKDMKTKWHFVDANGQRLGLLAVKIAKILMGKTNPAYAPNCNLGDKVVVTNVGGINVSANKMRTKKYIWHTGFPKGLRTETLETRFKKNPGKVLESAVYGMLPKNKLRKQMMRNLLTYRGSEHPHKGQEK